MTRKAAAAALAKEALLCANDPAHGPIAAFSLKFCARCQESRAANANHARAALVQDTAKPSAGSPSAPASGTGPRVIDPRALAPASGSRGPCSYCEQPIEGRYRVTIKGKNAELCNLCGTSYEPTIGQIEKKIEEREARACPAK